MADGQKATTHGGNYQNIVTTPLPRQHDDSATADDEDAEVDGAEAAANITPAHKVLSSIEKVGHLQIYTVTLFIN